MAIYVRSLFVSLMVHIVLAMLTWIVRLCQCCLLGWLIILVPLIEMRYAMNTHTPHTFRAVFVMANCTCMIFKWISRHSVKCIMSDGTVSQTERGDVVLNLWRYSTYYSWSEWLASMIEDNIAAFRLRYSTITHYTFDKSSISDIFHRINQYLLPLQSSICIQSWYYIDITGFPEKNDLITDKACMYVCARVRLFVHVLMCAQDTVHLMGRHTNIHQRSSRRQTPPVSTTIHTQMGWQGH